MKAKGFTLVEMVMTIIIMGIVFIGVGGFIEIGSKGYADSIDRQRLQNQAQFVIEKLSREIRHAVPASFNTYNDSDGSKCLSFYPIERAGFYYRNELNSTVSFTTDNQGSRLSNSSGSRLVINPSQAADLQDSGRSVALSGCLNESDSSCEEQALGSNVYTYAVNDSFASYSIASRYYTYSDLTAYCITSAGEIRKAIGSGNFVTVGNSLQFSDSQFLYSEPTLQRGGLVHMDLLFVNNGEESFYKHDVQVLNVP